MSHHQMNSLQEKLARQVVEIRDLGDKLVTYNTDMAIKDELNKQFIELDGWVEEAAIKLKETDAEQSSVVNGLFEKLKKSELAENSLLVDNHKLAGDNYSLSERLRKLECDDQTRRSEAETMETCIRKLENELRHANERSRELSERARCELDELHGVRDQLERCRVAVTLMKDCNGELRTELEGSRAAEGRREELCRGLAAETEDARAKLEDARAKLEDARAELKDERAKLEDARAKLEAARAELEDERAILNDARVELKDERARLEDARAKLEDVRAELENAEARVAEHEERGARERLEWEQRVRLGESRLEEAVRSAEARDRVDGEASERLRRELEATASEARQKTAAAADLERQVLELRAELERAAGDRLCGGGGGPPVAGADDENATRATTRPRPLPNARADDGDAADDDELVKTLTRLYHELEALQHANRTRRLGDDSANS